MSRTVQIVFDAADPARLGEFWAQALGYVSDPLPEGFATWPEALKAFGVPEAHWEDAWAVVDPDGVGPRLFFQRVPEAKTVKNTVHVDVRVKDHATSPDEQVVALEAEVERLVALGARVVERRTEMGSSFVVMQDVEGNELCLS